ncbi:MAG: tetratricopeptide repeat protein [Myxococcaceae bacterium]
MSEKLTRKELKKPDAFQKAGADAGAWVVERQKMVAMVIVAVLIVGFGASLVVWITGRGESSASKDLGAALKVMARPVSSGEKPAEPVPGEEPAFKSDKEKDEAVAKALTDFRANHSASRAAATAALPLAQASFRLGRYDDALKGYDEYLKVAAPDDPLRASALEGRGYAHEAKGELDAAIAAFDQLARDNKTEFLNGMGLYHRARILIIQGKKDEAAKQLSEIPSAAPNSAAARLATDRMALLASEGVKVPPPVPAVKTDAG